jgi:CheY-like chemotaxis protein
MAEQKRALVVDDSRSARLVLTRMLEKHGLLVDAVESASQALDFLSCNRPDVIFMDHMMPGMDGFEAIKAIKSNPATATIPVMMYTSKGGDLYVGQARALGAVGVLPKTVAPVELFESLQKIGLLEERRREDRQQEDIANNEDDESASERAEDIARRQETAPPPVTAFMEPGMQAPAHATNRELNQQLRSLLEEQRVEIRKDVLLSMENVARHTASKLTREVDEKFATGETPGAQAGAHSPSNLPVILMALLLLFSLGLNYSMHKSRSPAGAGTLETAGAGNTDIESARKTITELQTLQDETQAVLRSSWELAGWAMNQELDYAYDEIALDGNRAATIESLLEKLRETGFEGLVTLQTHAGEFCLLGSQEEGFRLPAPDLSTEDCDFIGNAVQAADTPSAHQSLRFANFLTSTPLLADDTISLEIVTLPRDEHLNPYPEKADATAQSWNDAAQANNRILIQLSPR